MKMKDILADRTGRMYNPYDEPYAMEVEAEFDIPVDFDGLNKKVWTETQDGSLMHFGREFITRGPFSLTRLAGSVASLFDLQPFEENYIQSTRTSTHVHVNILHWTKDELLTVLTAYYLLEPLLFTFCAKNRSSNLFCLPLNLAEDGATPVKNIVEGKYQHLIDRFDNYKYAALNVCNVSKIGTIEFRHFQGTKSAAEVTKWLSIIDRVCNTKSMFADPKAVWRAYTNNRLGFAKSILGNDLDLKRDDLYELLDTNYSTVFDIVFHEPKKQPPKAYTFQTERELDNLEN